MSTTPEFGTQLVGQTENALGAILNRQLAGSGMNRSQWISLTIAVMSGGTIDRPPYISRIVGALKTTEEDAQTQIDELVDARLLAAPDGDRTSLRLTDEGGQVHAGIRATVTEITQRLWGDLPTNDLVTAGRVLATVLERANAELVRT